MLTLKGATSGKTGTRPAANLNVAILLATLLLAGCTQEAKADPTPARPPLPKLQLHPMLAELQALASSFVNPDEKQQKQLQDYSEIALQLVETDTRTAGIAQRALLEDKQAWFVLEPALTHEQPAVRQRAAWLCGISGQTILQVPLLLRLKYELDPVTLIWVADALGKLGNDSGLMWLAAAFSREETANQAGQMAIAALTERNVEVPEDPSWADLGKLLQAQTRNWQKTGKSARAVDSAPDPELLTAKLAKHLQTPEGTQLRPVADARFVLTRLWVIGVPMLKRVLQAEEHYLRTMPLQVLADLGSAASDATDAIVPLLGDVLTASYAVRALGEIGATSTLVHLRPLLTDRDTEMRAAASQALGLLGDTESKALLEARLQDQQEAIDVRVGAAFGLLCLGEHAEASAYLDEREVKQDYHEPTLIRLRERLAARNN